MVVSGGVAGHQPRCCWPATRARWRPQDLFGDRRPAPPRSEEPTSRARSTSCWSASTRATPTTAPLSDSIIIVHVPESMTGAYLFSIPRDLVVDIPAFEKTDFRGGRAKINAAMAYGSQVPATASTTSPRASSCWPRRSASYTGIQRFDAGAIVNFSGFKKIVDAMGGVTMTIDQDVKSEHLQPDGKPRPKRPAAPEQLRAPVLRPAEASTRRAPTTSRAGRRWTTCASATACRTATTTGSATSSSSSGRWPSRRSARTW